MVDLETLSTRPNACIISIGACKFDFNGSIITDKFSVNVDPVSCKKLGLFLDPKTIDWWSKQSKEARQAWQVDPLPLPEAIEKFHQWWGTEKRSFWCNGLSFDAPIISSAYVAIGKTEGDKPWVYSDEMDLRTVYKMVGFDNKKARESSTVGVYHNALDDAIAQTMQLMELFGYDPF